MTISYPHRCKTSFPIECMDIRFELYDIDFVLVFIAGFPYFKQRNFVLYIHAQQTVH